MKKENTHLPDKVIFFSDAHLGLPGDTQEHIENVASFLRSLYGQVSHIYIVGDLFDFWFEYKHAVPNTAPEVVFELYRLTQSGVKVTLFCGNHDYWLGPYLRDKIGIEIIRDDKTVEHQGKRLYLHHGDGLYPGDHGYRILKAVLRNKLSIFLFGLLPPDIGHKIAMFSSKTSRNHLAPPKDQEIYSQLFRKIADNRLSDALDAVIYGHSHVRLIEERKNGTLVLLGDWLNNTTYLLLENGELALREWNDTTEAG